MMGMDLNGHSNVGESTPQRSKQSYNRMYRNGEKMTMLRIKTDLHVTSRLMMHKDWTKTSTTWK